MSAKRPTLKQVAEAAGCSTAVVSTVLNASKGNTIVSEAMRERVEAAALKVGYRVNAAARMMRQNRTHQIGVLIKNTPGDQFGDMAIMEFLLGINEGLMDQDYLMSLIRLDENPEAPLNRRSRVFREVLLDGMIVVSSFPYEIRQTVEDVMGQVVWLDTNHHEATNCVYRDEVVTGALAAREALRLGYTRILYLSNPDHDEIGRPQTHYSHRDRFTGVSQIAADQGIFLQRQIIPWSSSATPMPDILQTLQKGTAIITYNSRLAQRLTAHLLAQGNTLPEGVGLASCDLTQEQAASWPSLAGIPFPRYELGCQAAAMLLSTISQSEIKAASHLLQPTWQAAPSLPAFTSK